MDKTFIYENLFIRLMGCSKAMSDFVYSSAKHGLELPVYDNDNIFIDLSERINDSIIELFVKDRIKLMKMSTIYSITNLFDKAKADEFYKSALADVSLDGFIGHLFMSKYSESCIEFDDYVYQIKSQISDNDGANIDLLLNDYKRDKRRFWVLSHDDKNNNPWTRINVMSKYYAFLESVIHEPYWPLLNLLVKADFIIIEGDGQEVLSDLMPAYKDRSFDDALAFIDFLNDNISNLINSFNEFDAVSYTQVLIIK